jgi:transcriptional regulator with XRE-family HTH domain
MTTDVTPFGAFLRSRRAALDPTELGLPVGRRRVPGLRREELAALSGLSADYIRRLEQGRDKHPSSQCLDALGAALRLDNEETAYLYKLAGQAQRRSLASSTSTVSAGLANLLASWTTTPAVVRNPWMDIVAASPTAQAISPGFAPGGNLLRFTLLDERARALHQSWDRASERLVGLLRATVGPDIDDPRLVSMIDDLSTRSSRFRVLWERPDVQTHWGGMTVLNHPIVGTLELNFERFPIQADQTVVVMHAELGSPSHEALQRLLSQGGAGEP